MKYKPHPDGLEMTSSKIRNLFNTIKLNKEDKKKLENILLNFKNHCTESNSLLIENLQTEVDKFKNLKELLK